MGKKRKFRNQLMTCVTEVLESRRMLSTVAWTGAGDGVNWTDPNNWSTHALPGSGDDAVINTSGGAITLNGTETVRSLNTVRAFTLASGSLSLAGGTGAPTSGVAGAFNIAAGATLNVASGEKLELDSAYNTVESLTVNGTLNLANGSSMTLDTSAGYANTQLLVYGTVNATGVTFAPSYVQNTTSMTVYSGGHLVASNSTIKYNTATINSGSSVSFIGSQLGATYNFGIGGNGLTLSNLDYFNATNGATIVIPESLQINTSGVFTISANSALTVNGNLLGTTQSTAAFNPLGTVTLNGTGTASSPELLEAMGADVGNASTGFVNNFAFGTLILSSKTYVKLVDQSHNTASTSSEAVYVNSLIVPVGATLNLNGLHLYARDAQIGGTITGGTINQIPNSGPLAVDSPAPGKISTAGELDDWTFYDTAGDTVAVSVDPGSGLAGGPISPLLGYAQVQLLDPSGAVIATGSSTSAGGIVNLTNVSLTSSGTYTVAVKAASSNASNTGDYVVAAYDVTSSILALNLNQPQTSTLTTPFSVDHWSFSAVAGTQVQFVLAGESASGLQFSLTGPGGFTGFANAVGSSALINLPTAGTYTFTAQGTGGAIGSYTFQMNQTNVQPLTLGVAANGTFAGSGQAQLYSALVTTADPLSVSLTDPSTVDHVELYASLGSPPTRENYQYAENGGGSNQSIFVPDADPGTWYFLVYAESVAAPPSSYSIQAHTSEIILGSATPNMGVATALTTLTIAGDGFKTGTTVSLESASNAVYPATTSVLNLPTQMTATFKAGSIPAGTYSIKVTQADGASAMLSSFFTMAATGQGVLTTNLELPNPMSRHIAETIYVDYANTGTAAMPAPLLILGATNPLGQDGALMTLDPALQGEGLWTNNTPAGYSQSIEILASGATPGVLQPGESERIPVYYAGWLTSQWDFSAPTLNFSLKVVQPTDQSAMNWNGVTYVTGTQSSEYLLYTLVETSTSGFSAAVPWVNGVPPTQSQIVAELENGTVPIEYPQGYGPPSGSATLGISCTIATTDNEQGIAQQPPASIPAAAWSVISSNLQSTFGSTLGGYVQALDSEANYLGQLGENVTDVQSLWGFAVQQADNALSPLSPYLASATDDSVAMPGSLSLDFSRVFAESISGRDTVSTLGTGWSTPWQTTATFNSDGSVTITGPAGGQQLFEPDNRTSGVYFSQPGDTSTLTADGSGGYLLTASDGTETDYTSAGPLNYMQDTNGNRITAGYTSGKLVSLNASTGQYIHIGYNSAGLIASLTDSTGRSVAYSYDATNTYLTSVKGYNGQSTVYGYNTTAGAAAQNTLTSITFPGSTHQYFTYDSQGRIASTYSDGGAQPQTFNYSLGQVSVTDGTTDTSSVYYNENGQVAKSVDGLGNPTFYTYDGDYDLKTVTNAQGAYETYTYNSVGEATSSTDFIGNTTQFVYGGPHNELTSMKDANGNVTQYGYDASGDLLSTSYADSTHSNSTFNPLGEATSFVNQNGQPINYTYNAAGQVATESFSDGSSYAYTYNTYGSLLTATDSTGVTTFTYDPTTELMTEVAYPGGLYLKFTYNTAGQRTQMVDQTGFTTNYIYDTNGRLSQLTDGGGNVIVTYTYDADGRLARKVNGNGTYTTYTYDADGNVLTLFNYAPGGTVNSSFVYTYNNLGLETTETTIDGQWVYGYDADGQLTHAVFTPNTADPDGLTLQNMVYNYDPMGNRTSTVINGVTTVYITNNTNEYTSVGGVRYTYDADGNLTSDGTNAYTYNSLNQLASLVQAGTETTYKYDSLGYIFSSTIGGVTTLDLVDPAGLGEIVGQFASAGSVQSEYIYGHGLASQIFGGQKSFIDFDAAGSTVGVSAISGAYIYKLEYLPFGTGMTTGTGMPTPFQYEGTSGVIAIASGLILMRARLLSTIVGRFTSRDPIGAELPNLYAYASNNPVEFGDPSGLLPLQGPAFSAYGPNSTVIAIGKTLQVGIVEGPNGYGFTFIASPGLSLPISMTTYPNGATTGMGLSYNNVDNPFESVPMNSTFRWDDDSGQMIPDGFFTANTGYGSPALGPSVSYTTEPTSWTHTTLFWIIVDFRVINHLVSLIAAPFSSGQTKTVNDYDPNSLYGPSGSGTSNFVAASDNSYPYLIDFENSPTATAPVQYLTVTDQLDPNLNWSTFQLTGIGWGNFYLTIPAGSQTYQTMVLMTENGQTFDVEVNAGIHTSTGQVYATFQCIDPATGLPPSNPLTGFLPPESGTGNGSGYLSYTVSPKAGLPTGTQIRNVASINFDQGLSIATDEVNDENLSQGIDPTKQALVTIDAGNPTSSVAALPPTEAATNFNVSWGGVDDTGGSGIATYTIYVSANGTPFVAWLTNTNTTSGTFVGSPGYTYSFYSVATDNVGNVQPTPTSAQATTTVSGTARQSLTLNGSAEYLQLDADGTHLDVWNSTSLTGSPTQYLLSGLSSIVVSGAAAGTSLTVDFTNGDPLVSSGLTFAGVAGKTNTLNLIGTAGNDYVAVNGTSVIEAAAFGSASITYSNLSAVTFNGGGGSDTLTQTAQPGAPVSFLGTTFSDTLSVNAGTFTFPASLTSAGIAQIDLGTLSIGAAAKVTVAQSVSHVNRSVLILNSLSLAGSAGSWTGTLDLADNDLVVNGGSLATEISQIQSGRGNGNWTGTGLTSSTAANNSTHLTALGILPNVTATGGPFYGAGTAFGLFDGVNPSATAVLVKYTYYGDANLDGAVDGSDYSKIDNGFINHLTGWYNGDFNYDGKIDGTDYTLIDNTYNTQGSRLSNLTPTLTLPAAPSVTYDGTSDVTSWVVPTLTGPAGDPTPTGTVTLDYFIGSSITGTALAAAPIVPGTYTVEASYAGDSHYAAELSNAVTFTINKAAATVTLAAGPGTVKYDGTSDITNWVKGFATGISGAAMATGTVTPVYYSGTTATGTPLSTSPINAGTYTVVGSYSGDSNYAASFSAPITFTISATSGAQPLTLTGAAIYLKLDVDGQHVDVWDSTVDTGSPAQSVLLSTISSISIDGVAAGTTLSVDFSAGDPLVPSGLNFNGLTGANNTLKVINSGDSSTASYTVNASTVFASGPSGTAPLSYSNTTAINIYAGLGTETLTQNVQPGSGATSLSYLNTTASDNLIINAGTFNFAASSAGAGITSVTLGNVFVEAGTAVTVAAPDVHADRHVLVLSSLFIAGSTNAWQAQLNLTGNDLIVHNGNLTLLTNQIASGYSNGTWTGQGITSSTAAANTSHLTSLGVELNNNGNNQPLFGNGTALGLFDSQNPSTTDVLIKYTYYGDANLDGKVDGSDYARIDNGFLTHATGWSNGDFNYDGSINGTDYTLIDNAFNTQGASMMAVVSTASEASSRAHPMPVSKEHRAQSARLTTGTPSFTANMFQSWPPIVFSSSKGESIEQLMNEDRLDVISSLVQ
jgi:RHS repeat-associated protein